MNVSGNLMIQAGQTRGHTITPQGGRKTKRRERLYIRQSSPKPNSDGNDIREENNPSLRIDMAKGRLLPYKK